MFQGASGLRRRRRPLALVDADGPNQTDAWRLSGGDLRAIGYTIAGPIRADGALCAFDANQPLPGPHDLLVEVRGVSVNPIDTKLRRTAQPGNGPRILGFDAAGVVREVGAATSLFRPGDPVYYAGDVTRPGSNADYQCVDERIVGRMPASLDFVTAAGLPLTTITAWELLFDSLMLQPGGGAGDALLVVGGAGGVGSILIQLAKALTGLQVIATASRPESRAWVERMGADEVVDHHQPLPEQMRELGVSPRFVASLTHTEDHFPSLVELVRPRGHIAVIDSPAALDVVPLKSKALSLSWEFMFARPMHQLPDIDMQHHLLNRVAELLDDGTLIPTVTARLGVLSVSSLTAAHEQQESGHSIGKTVLAGFGGRNSAG